MWALTVTPLPATVDDRQLSIYMNVVSESHSSVSPVKRRKTTWCQAAMSPASECETLKFFILIAPTPDTIRLR